MAHLGGGAVKLVLSESAEVPGHAAPWIGPLLALGTRASRYKPKLDGRQLIIAVSVPRRDFASVLIACGWALASKPPELAEPLQILRTLVSGQPMRAVTGHEIISGRFSSLDEDAHPPRVHFAGSSWRVDAIRAVAPLPETDETARCPRPDPGSLEHMAHLNSTWDERLVKPAADLAIVGVEKRLREDIESYLSKEDDMLPPTAIKNLLMPKGGRAATWSTRLFASAKLADSLPIPEELNAVILDGTGAIKYLLEIETPIVVCVLDRSVANEAAAELIIQVRNTRGQPLSLADDLEWSPPLGAEALAFTVPL